LNKLLADAGPPTEDDVSVTRDGRRLDSAKAVIEFVEELRRSDATDKSGG
jgi:hypothetical protein